MEIQRSLATYLVSAFASFPVSETGSMRSQMVQQLFDGDVTAFETNMRKLFANIPYQLHIPRESYYHSLFLLWLSLLGFEIGCEVSTDKGRMDAVWTWKDRVIITELKYTKNGSVEHLLEDAMTQMLERRYYERYAKDGSRIALLAIVFVGKEASCRIKEL